MKKSNRFLLLIFATLLVLYLLSRLFGGQKERSFDPLTVEVDTSRVSRLVFDPGEGEPFQLQREGNGWTLIKNAKSLPATQGSVQTVLRQLANIEASRVVSRKKEKWADYEVDSQKGMHIEVFEEDEKRAGLIIGRFNMNPQTRSGTSYIRSEDQDEVYSVDGFLSINLKQNADNFRDKTLVKVSNEEIAVLSFTYTDEKFSILRNEKGWSSREISALDSSKVKTYLSSLERMSGASFFDDDFEKTLPNARLEIILSDGKTETVESYSGLDEEATFILLSSMNSETTFASDSSGVFKRIFKPSSFFSLQ